MKRWAAGFAVAVLAITVLSATSAQTTGAGDTLTLIYVSTSN